MWLPIATFSLVVFERHMRIRNGWIVSHVCNMSVIDDTSRIVSLVSCQGKDNHTIIGGLAADVRTGDRKAKFPSALSF